MTGERGLGWAAFHGARRISVAEVSRYRIYQELVSQVATDDGRKELERRRALRRADEALRAKERATQTRDAHARASHGTPMPPAQIVGAMPPFDPMRMTPDEVAAWARRYTPPV